MSARTEADDLLGLLRRGGEPDWTAGDAKRWAMLIDQLVQQAQFDAAARAALELGRRTPGAGVFDSFSLLIGTAPPPTGDAVYDAFRDDPEADVQVVRRLGATRVLLVFTGVGGRIGMPLPLAHRWFGPLQVHIVYLRDLGRQAYNDGVRGLGATYGASLDALWRLTDALNARAILTCGNSVGGYGALRYGLDLRAQAMLAFSTSTSLAPPISPADEVRRRGFRPALDLRPFFMVATPPARTLLVYGAECIVDARQAERLAGAPGVSLQALPGCERHEAMLRAVELGRLGELLHHLVQS